MAKLHIFNPEHDIALASNLANFTAPHAGRLLRADLGWIAAIWADAGDFVWVEDAEHAERTYRRTLRRRKCPVQWIDKKGVHALNIDAIEPWGWDAALCRQLTRADVDAALLPSAGCAPIACILRDAMSPTDSSKIPILFTPGLLIKYLLI